MKLKVQLALCILIINPLYCAQNAQTIVQEKPKPTLSQQLEKLWDTSKANVATIFGALALATALYFAPRLEEQPQSFPRYINFPIPTKKRPDFVTLTTVFAAVRNGRFPILRHYIEQHDENPNMTDDHGNTLLMAASERGHNNIVAYLLTNPYTSVDARNKYNDTALMKAVVNQHPQIVKDLLSAGANFNTANNKGESAYSLSHNNQEIRDMIINRQNLNKHMPQHVKTRSSHASY